MTVVRRSAVALLVSVSSFALLSAGGRTAFAQQAVVLDPITVLATKTPEATTDALAPVSVIGQDKIEMTQPKRVSDLFYFVPGLWTQDRGDDPATTLNIRGLQDFGRVATIVDGARQNYQRSGHGAQGSFFLDPELIGSVDVVRGPTANIYGSGAIGGVVSFQTKDINDVLRPGEKWGFDIGGGVGSNQAQGNISTFGGVRVNPNLDLFAGAVYRSQQNYKDGAGTEIGNTDLNASSGLFKVTVRPADGHEVKLGGLFQEDKYFVGQLNRGPTATAAQRALYQGSSVYDSVTKNYQGTLRWKYSRPEDRLFDFDLGIYATRTATDQWKTYHYSTAGAALCGPGSAGNNISGCVGDPRSYQIDTVGFDFSNTSRVAVGNWENAFTYGIDGFQDDVSSADTRGNSNITTPSGKRTVSGGFLQWKANYSRWLEIVSAARYDHYRLESASTTTDGSRLSPKITIGVTPVPGVTPYVSYAEGYRAPSVTETLIAGAHATGGGPAFFTCPDGTTGLFCFLPNANLRPEVGKNKEVGVNFKFDSIATKDDTFRAKINAFQNDVDDYIDLVASTPVPTGFGSFSQYYQYQNIPSARIRGFEFEANYDAGGWFVGVNGTLQKGENTQTGVGLASIQPGRVTTTGGVRLLDRKLTLSAQWSAVSGNDDLPAGYVPSTSYNLVNLYATYLPTKNVTINLGIDNVLNEYYRPYAVPGSSTDGTSQNDILWTAPGPGITYKAAVKVHFGGV
jgi:hemoglobin/transferrin/lactoferrin receptor protein